MKRTLTLLFAMLFVIATSCKKDDPKPAPGKDDPKTPPTEKVEVTSVTLNKTTLTLTVDNKETLTATIAPENATDKTITWSSSKTDIATVDKTGAVTAVAAGEATITATSSNGKKAECKVTVKAKEIPVESIALNKTELTLTEGSEYTLQLTILPEGATYTTIEWTSSEESIATINQEGMITAIAEGETTITATIGEKSATCKLTVEKLLHPVESVSIDKTEADIILGETLQLTATISPSNATNKNVIWSSEDETIATVNQEGEVIAKAEGETTITVTTSEGSKTATCKITILPTPITAIAIIPAEITIKDGATQTLTVEFTPASSTASREVEWASYDDTTVSVDQDGKITGLKVGTTNVQVRLKSNNAITATCKVTVEQDATLKGIALNVEIMELQVGKSGQLTVAYNPEYATNKTVSWVSTNPSVATVDNTGKVTAVAIGTATITATSEEGNYTATCEVNVVVNTIDIYYTASGALYKNNTQLLWNAGNFKRILFLGEDEYYLNDDILTKNGSKYFTLEKTISSDSWVACMDMAIDPTSSNIYLLHKSYPSESKFHRVSKLSPDKVLTEIEIETSVSHREFERVVATTSGDIIIYGLEVNAFNEYIGYYWKISPSGSVTKTPTGISTNFFVDMVADNQGNYWVVTIDGKVYKNGTLEYTLPHKVLRSYGRKICCRNNDIYVMCENIWSIPDLNKVIDRVNIYKNGTLLKEFEFENIRGTYFFDVSSKDDIYMMVPSDTDNRKRYVYKNNNILFEARDGYYLEVKE